MPRKRRPKAGNCASTKQTEQALWLSDESIQELAQELDRAETMSAASKLASLYLDPLSQVLRLSQYLQKITAERPDGRALKWKDQARRICLALKFEERRLYFVDLAIKGIIRCLGPERLAMEVAKLSSEPDEDKRVTEIIGDIVRMAIERSKIYGMDPGFCDDLSKKDREILGILPKDPNANH